MSNARAQHGGDVLGRVEGALLGAAIGDALGWPIEPRGSRVGGTRDIEPQLDFIAWDRREGGRYSPFIRHVPAGTYSDDTQLILAVGRSLLRGEHWWQHLTELELPIWTLYELGGGGAVRRAAAQWERGTQPWSDTLKLADRRRYFDAGGNGVVMRIAPHAVAAIDDQDFSRAATRIVADGAATHGHPRALVGGLVAGYSLWRALRWDGKLHYGALIDETLAEQAEWVGLPDIDHWAPEWRSSADTVLDADFGSTWDRTVDEMLELLASAKRAMSRGSLARDSEVLRELGVYGKEGSCGTRTAAVGIYLASRYVAQPPAGLLAAAFGRNTDADTIASVTGSLLGAMAGADWIRPLAVGLQDADYVRRLSAALVQGIASTDQVDGTAIGVRRRVRGLLAKLEADEPADLPVFGRSHLLRIEEHPTESANDIRTWWLDTDEGQTIAITRISKHSAEGRGREVKQTGKTAGPARSARLPDQAQDVYWFALPVADLERSTAFYRDILGLHVTRSGDTFVRFGRNLVLEKAGADLHRTSVEEEPGGSVSGGLLTILVDEAPFQERLAALQRAGVSMVEPPGQMRGHRVRLRDPDGHVIELRSPASQEQQPVAQT